MNQEEERVLSAWGLEAQGWKKINDNVFAVGDRYILKRYGDRALLERNLYMLTLLDEMRIPVGRIAPARDGRKYVQEGESCWFLAEKLSGSGIVKVTGDDALPGQMGEILARLHQAFLRCEQAEGFRGDLRECFRENSLLEEMRGWVKEALRASGWEYVTEQEYESLLSRLEKLYPGLPVQLIHRDVHFGNFLFSEGKFSGYIDFDLSQRNIRIFDLCYFCLGLLSDQAGADMTEEQWLLFTERFFAGYEEKLPLCEAEKESVPVVMECIELLFAAWFARAGQRGPAENARELYRFVREREKRIVTACSGR